jgi:hypothetical protein
MREEFQALGVFQLDNAQAQAVTRGAKGLVAALVDRMKGREAVGQLTAAGRLHFRVQVVLGDGPARLSIAALEGGEVVGAWLFDFTEDPAAVTIAPGLN